VSPRSTKPSCKWGGGGGGRIGVGAGRGAVKVSSLRLADPLVVENYDDCLPSFVQGDEARTPSSPTLDGQDPHALKQPARHHWGVHSGTGPSACLRRPRGGAPLPPSAQLGIDVVKRGRLPPGWLEGKGLLARSPSRPPRARRDPPLFASAADGVGTGSSRPGLMSYTLRSSTRSSGDAIVSMMQPSTRIGGLSEPSPSGSRPGPA